MTISELVVKYLIIVVFIAFIIPYPTPVPADGMGADNEQPNLRSVQSILGPVSVNMGETLRICTADASGFIGPPNTEPMATFWSSTVIEIYNIEDTSVPLLTIPDISFRRGEGQCVDIDGNAIMSTNSSVNLSSVLFVVTTLSEAQARISPIVSGQFGVLGGDSKASLLLPAVQKVESNSGSGTRYTCCPCAPACACGVAPSCETP
jgi:hypothetical protein